MAAGVVASVAALVFDVVGSSSDIFQAQGASLSRLVPARDLAGNSDGPTLSRHLAESVGKVLDHDRLFF